MKKFIDSYFYDFNHTLKSFLNISENKISLNKAVNILKSSKNNNKTIFIIGNGGSASISEHMAIDLTKNAGLKAISFSSASTITTYANDFGYENLFKKALDQYSNNGDILIAISGTGTSKNILNACTFAKDNNMKIITLSGFDSNNPLSNLGDINFWVNSKAFGFLEIIHSLLIHYINDAIIGRAEYMIR